MEEASPFSEMEEVYQPVGNSCCSASVRLYRERLTQAQMVESAARGAEATEAEEEEQEEQHQVSLCNTLVYACLTRHFLVNSYRRPAPHASS